MTITMEATAEVRNTSTRVVLDGGRMVTLSDGGARRILYMNTCDQALGTASSDCFNQQWLQLIVQNMTFTGGNSTARQTSGNFGGPSGGGAIFDLGGQLKVVNSALPDDPSDGFETPGFPGIFYVGPGRPVVISSTLG